MSADLSGLDDFNVSSFLTGEKPPKQGVLTAPIERFKPDERNARTVFDDESINQLVDSMLVINDVTNEPRGILQPLSVKKDPENDGFFIINGGHRRLMAAKKAGLTEIPYFISDNTNHFDNVVDNLIREGLKTKDLANFVREALQEGLKTGDIANRLGKPASFVSDYSVYFEMIDGIKNLHTSGLCENMQTLAKLHRASKKYPDEIANYVESDIHFTPNNVSLFIRSLKEENKKELEKDLDVKANNEPKDTDPVKEQEQAEQGADQILANDKSDSIKKPLILVVFDEREAIVLVKQRVPYGMVAIKYQDDGQELIVSVNDIALTAIIEG